MKITTMRDIREILVEGERVSVVFPTGYERVKEGHIMRGDLYYNRNGKCFHPVSEDEIGCSVEHYIYIIRSTKPVKEKVKKSADAKRLDWLQKHRPEIAIGMCSAWVRWGPPKDVKEGYGKTLRKAIDEGMDLMEKIKNAKDKECG